MADDNHSASIDLLAHADGLSLRELVDAVWEDLRTRYAAGERPTVEEYLGRFPALAEDEQAAVDVVYFDFLLRQETGDDSAPADYLARFPQYAEPLNRQFSVFAAVDADFESVAESDRVLVDPQQTTEIGWAEDTTPPSRPQRAPREILPERFQFVEEVGRGGMGVVYKALQTDLNRLVALKMILAGPHANEQILGRFHAEAEAVAKLQHPNIVQIYEIGEYEERPFLSLEFIDGGTLHDRLDGKPLDAIEAAELVEKLAHAVEYAHRRGVVHRDLKPANVLLQDADLATPKITDFGLAKHTEFDRGRTRTGDIVGTPTYMAPEQASGRPGQVGPPADIYALGAILFELITGRPPFTGETLLETLQQVRTKLPTPPRRLRRGVPRDLDTICVKCLEKTPVDRYTSASELAEELRRFRTGRPIMARPIGLLEQSWRWAKRHPAIAALTAAVLVVLGFTAGVAMQLQAVKAAEEEKTQLLSSSYLASGRLAMQRGRFREALRLFDQSLAQGHEDRAAIQILQIESHFVLREFDEAEDLLSAIKSSPGTLYVAGQVSLWKAELALRSSSSEAVRRHYEEALESDLSAADEVYVAAMLSDKSKDAVARFHQVLHLNPFHHRARTMLVNLLVFLGRLDEAAFQATVGQQLFPEDPYFFLVEGLVLAAEGELNKSRGVLDQLQLSETHKEAWLSSYELTDSLVAAASRTRSLTTQIGSKLAASVLREQDALATVADFGLRFPPALGERLIELNASLKTNDHGRLKSLLAKLVQTHEEGTLYLWLGEYHIADAYGDGNVPAGDELEAARDAFVSALATPSFLRNHEHAARLGIIGTTSYLGPVLYRDRDANLKLATESLRALDSRQGYPSELLRAFTLVSFEAEDADLCRAWLNRWSAAPDADRAEVLKYRVELEIADERYDAALQGCEQLLSFAPNDVAAQTNRKWAVHFLRESLSQEPDEDPARMHSWQGTWTTTSGTMELTQVGDVVEGTYTHDGGKFRGVAAGRVVTGRWSEAPTYDPAERDAGKMQLLMSDDGRSFAGKWRYGFEGPLSHAWNGQRQTDPTYGR